MTRRARIWLGSALGMVVLAAVAALLVVRMMNAPMFEPGTVRARIAQQGERFDPPPQPGDGALWQVTPDISLHHTSTGSGDDVLLVHGGPGYPPRENWRATAILARSYRVHAYDQRGCGRSTRPFTAALEGSFYDKLRTVETRLGLAAQIADLMTLGVYASLGRSHDWRPAFQRVRTLTLVLHGADDLQPESDTRTVATAIPGARVEVIAAPGHFLPDAAPEAFAESVRRFLAQVP